MADSPKQAEAAQALFSAIVDYRGAPIREDIPNYTKFSQTYKKEIRAVSRKVVTPGVSSASIEQLLNKDKDWFKSSINIANKLFSDTRIHRPPATPFCFSINLWCTCHCR